MLQVKCLKNYDDALYANDDILFCNEDFNKVTFIANQRHILAIDFDKINLDEDNYFDENDPDTFVHVRFLAWRTNFEKYRALKKR